MARENNRVQAHIMDRLDILLDIRVVESDLAIALKEACIQFKLIFKARTSLFNVMFEYCNIMLAVVLSFIYINVELFLML